MSHFRVRSTGETEFRRRPTRRAPGASSPAAQQPSSPAARAQTFRWRCKPADGSPPCGKQDANANGGADRRNRYRQKPCLVILDALFCLGSVIHGPNQPAANGMACKPSCEAAGWGGLDRASSQGSWPSGARKPLTRPTPAPKPAADPGKSWTAVGSPSPASRRFDQRKILRTRRDLISPAPSLRVGRQGRRSGEQQRDRERKRDFAHRFPPWICG
jgi:hypothetical protein